MCAYDSYLDSYINCLPCCFIDRRPATKLDIKERERGHTAAVRLPTRAASHRPTRFLIFFPLSVRQQFFYKGLIYIPPLRASPFLFLLGLQAQ